MENNNESIKSNSAKSAGYIKIILAAICWGTLPIISRFLYSKGVEPLEAAAMRAYVAAIILTAITFINGSIKAFKVKNAPFYALNGLVTVTGTYTLYFMAISRLSSSMAVMLLYTAPAFVIVFLRLIYKTPVTASKLIALICTFAGCFFVVKGYDVSSLYASIGGIIFGLLSGVSYAMFTVFGVKGLKMYPPMVNVAMQTVFGALFFVAIKPPWEIAVSSAGIIIGFICIGIVGSVIPYSLYLRGLKDGVDGGAASILAYIEPVFATVSGMLIFHETLEFLQVMGIALVLFGAFYSVHNGKFVPLILRTFRKINVL